MKNNQDPMQTLLQVDIIEGLLPTFGKGPWQSLYLSERDGKNRLGIFCALLDDAGVARALAHDSWDMAVGDGKPGFSQSFDNARQEVTTYHRFGSHSSVRPLVHYRSFHDAFPDYVEMDEEFRLYHDLAEDKKGGRLLAFDSSGREIEVVRLEPKNVTCRLKHIRQFLAGVRLHLAIFVDSVRYSTIPLSEVPTAEREIVVQGANMRWRRNVVRNDFDRNFETFSRVLAKVVIPAPSQNRAGIWPFEVAEHDKEVSFVIGTDENGDGVEHTSDPEKLGNYFGANQGSAHYLTPVHFRREVLTKYYAESDRYSVSDGQLSCLSLWSCQIDNDIKDRVSVFLGDLGRDLPYEERLHWRQFNIPPEGGISETNFRRSFLAQFTNATAPDLVFRQEYDRINLEWPEHTGWRLFLPLSPGDSHLPDVVRVPLTNSQMELDEQIAVVTKLLIDSLNEKEIEARAAALPEGAKGIGKFDAFLEAAKFGERQSVIQFFRDLQSLRSMGSAHRKGSSYEKIIAKLGIDPARKPDAVRRILEEAIAALRALRVHFLPNSASE